MLIVCRAAGMNTRKEQACARDAELLLLSWNKGRHLAVEFVLENSRSASRWPLSPDKMASGLADAEHTKATAAEARCARAGWDFQGSAFSLWGEPGPAA